MNTSWLDLLSNVDKMVMGSIVGSVVLAFVLLVVIFSLKIRAQQKTIVRLRKALREKILHIHTLQEQTAEQVAAHARVQKALEAAEEEQTTTVRQLEEARQHIREHKETIAVLNRQRSGLEEQVRRLHEELRSLREQLAQAERDKEAVVRRNEFWVEQIAQLRNKYEALQHQINRQERS